LPRLSGNEDIALHHNPCPLNLLALEAGVELERVLLALQPFAVEARDKAVPFPLPAGRPQILEAIDRLCASVLAHPSPLHTGGPGVPAP